MCVCVYVVLCVCVCVLCDIYVCVCACVCATAMIPPCQALVDLLSVPPDSTPNLKLLVQVSSTIEKTSLALLAGAAPYQCNDHSHHPRLREGQATTGVSGIGQADVLVVCGCGSRMVALCFVVGHLILGGWIECGKSERVRGSLSFQTRE